MLIDQLTFVADGGIRSESSFRIVWSLELGQDGAGYVETRDHVLLGKLESNTLGIVVDILNSRNLEGDKALITTGKGWLGRNIRNLGC